MDSDSFSIERTNNLVVVTIMESELDEVLVSEITDALMDRARCDGVVFFVINMAKVSLLTSRCLGVLITFMRDLEQMRGRIVLAQCNATVKMLFEMTNLDSLIGLYDEIDEACVEVKR